MSRFAAFFWFFCFPVILIGLVLIGGYFTGAFFKADGWRAMYWLLGIILFGMPVVQLIFYFRYRGLNENTAKGILYALLSDLILIPAMYLYFAVFQIFGVGF
jgi:MFS family permease